jgi:clan AA aspartic protease (TIGR02281 family)
MKHLVAGLILTMLAAPAFSENIQIEESHGVYMLPVRINDTITIPFVLDSGAGDVSVPEDVFKTLIRTRTVTENDFREPGVYVAADGSKRMEPRFILHEVRVGDHVVKDVVASVAPDKADPLLGQSFLNKLPTWTMDNTRHTLVFGSTASPPAVTSPQVNKLPYLFERLANPANTLYKLTFDKLFRHKRNIAGWFVGYINARDGVDTPGKEITIGATLYEIYAVCQPHNCAGSFIHIVFIPGGRKAWAFLTSENGHYQLFGQSQLPDLEETAVIHYLRKGAQTVWLGTD